jgi:inner membrane protein
MEWLHNTVVGRVVLLALLVLALQLPIHWIHGLVGEREANRIAAVAEVQASAGGVQLASGPMLLVPYLGASTGFFDPSTPSKTTKRNYAILRPHTLEIRGTIAPVVRARGIFDVLVYRTTLHFDAEFARPDPADLGLVDEQIIWSEVVVAFSNGGVPELVSVAGASVELELGPVEKYLVAPAPASDTLSVAYDLELAGSSQLLFWPSDNMTSIALDSEWPHPKFVGTHLPDTRDVGSEGFTAEWNLPRRARPRLQVMGVHLASAAHSAFGVELIQPVDAYRMTRRAMKYEFLFTALTLGVFFLVEVFSRSRVHIVQYLFVGSALVLFYLLILSLSEHISFELAYSVASFGVVVLVWGYAQAIFDAASRAAIVGSVLSMLYGFLFVLLAAQDYSLLMGSLGLFLMLAGAMFFTRDIDWYALGGDSELNRQRR